MNCKPLRSTVVANRRRIGDYQIETDAGCLIAAVLWVDDAPRNETLGQRVKRLRQRQKLSVDRFARAADVSRNQVVSVEADATRNLRSDTLTRYARVLGVPPEYVLTGLSPPEEEEAPLEVSILYRELDEPMKRAFLRIGHTLREAQSDYGAEEIDTSQMAAFDEPGPERQIAEEEEPWPS